MDYSISPELQALFDQMKESEARIPVCPKCGAKRTFVHSTPGVECRTCGARWLWSLPSGKEIEVEQVEFVVTPGFTGTMWVPKKTTT
jgi:DNA-directed RNA polymerase subunit RPC12/RpoP